MRPRRIILIRHAESVGNADKSVYERIPDHRIDLTLKGLSQAREAGMELKRFLGKSPVRFYYSPYLRSRRTLHGILESFADSPHRQAEEPRMREQDWGHLIPAKEMERIRAEREEFGPFYYRLPSGESCADVFDRVSTFLETLHRDFEDEDYEENAVIVTHGITLRLFLLRWYHWSVADFASLKEPENCHYVVMERMEEGPYRILTPDSEFPGRDSLQPKSSIDNRQS